MEGESTMFEENLSRRDFLRGVGVVAGATALGALSPARLRAAQPPSAPVSLGGCQSYELPAVTAALQATLDRIGGLRNLVAGKTVTVKLNLTGNPAQGTLGLPAGRTYQTHPNVAHALAILLDRAGARRIRFVENTYEDQPFETTLRSGGWDIPALTALTAKVEFEDTRNLGQGKQYHRVKVPSGGSLFPAYDLNHSYVDCDVYISLAKLKNHATAGVTLAMKNNFGVTPTALYGQSEPNEHTTNARVDLFHEGRDKPAAGLPQEVDPHGPRVPSYRVPRHIVDAIQIRPIHLAIIDGIESVSNGEGPWNGTLTRHTPHLLIAGRNPVCTDAIATVCMGYDPMAKSATGPFPGDNHLAMAAQLGLGTNNPKEIEVRGLSIAQARHPFGWEPAERHT
jgi:uncharacterized protein (DUF362 family)